MSKRYSHRFLIPSVIVSLTGITVAVGKYFLTQIADIYDIVVAVSCLAGVVIVCADRRRAYRTITFGGFMIRDQFLFWMLQKLSFSSILIGLISDEVYLRLTACAIYLLLTFLIRRALVRVKQRNAYY